MKDDTKILAEEIMGWRSAENSGDWYADIGGRISFDPKRNDNDLMMLWDEFASKVHGTSICHNKANDVHIAYWCNADEVRRNTTTDHDRRKAMCDCMLGWARHLTTKGD